MLIVQKKFAKREKSFYHFIRHLNLYCIQVIFICGIFGNLCNSNSKSVNADVNIPMA